jgi:cell division septal protein FtsQ
VTVKATADKRFRRAQVKPPRRRGWRTAWTWRMGRAAAIGVLVLYGSYRAYGLTFAAPGLRVSRIVVRGNARLSTGEVLSLVDGLRGTSILRADLDGWRRRLRTSPWVADAALRRVLPSTIEVRILERTPLALGRINGALYLIDRLGTIVDEYGPHYAEFDLPIVDGLAAAPKDGALVDEARARLAARVIDAVARRRDIARQLSQIDVTDAHDAVVILEGDSALLHLGEEQFLERLQSYIDLAPALRARVPGIDYVDLRFDERVYVRPTGGAAKPVARPANGTAGGR